MTAPLPIGGKPIRQPDRRGLADALRLIGFTAAVAAPLLAYVALSSVYQLAAEYRVSALLARRQQLERERDRLSLQKASLLALPTVAAVAGEKLGLVPEDAGEPSVERPLEPPKPAAAAGAAAGVPASAPRPAKVARAPRVRRQ